MAIGCHNPIMALIISHHCFQKLWPLLARRLKAFICHYYFGVNLCPCQFGFLIFFIVVSLNVDLQATCRNPSFGLATKAKGVAKVRA
jgi:hypothetical protein